MDRPHGGPAGPAGPGGAPVSAIIEARGMVKSFGQTPALRGASITVRQGEILAVMGPSGSGKSTLLHCLAGILIPDEGEVWFGGQRLDTLSENRRSELRRDRFGFVFQSGQLVPELTAEENVALPLLLGGTRRRRPRRGQALVRPARPGRPRGPPLRRAVRRPGAARRAGPGPGRRARGPVRRRADRLAGLGVRRAGDEPADRRRPRAGHHGHPGHPRRPGRRLRRPGGHRPGRHGQLAHRRDAVIRLGLRLARQRRPGGRCPPGHPGRRRRARRRPAADRAIRRSTRSTRRTPGTRGCGPEPRPSPPGTRRPARIRCGGAPAATISAAS